MFAYRHACAGKTSQVTLVGGQNVCRTDQRSVLNVSGSRSGQLWTSTNIGLHWGVVLSKFSFIARRRARSNADTMRTSDMKSSCRSTSRSTKYLSTCTRSRLQSSCAHDRARRTRGSTMNQLIKSITLRAGPRDAMPKIVGSLRLGQPHTCIPDIPCIPCTKANHGHCMPRLPPYIMYNMFAKTCKNDHGRAVKPILRP